MTRAARSARGRRLQLARGLRFSCRQCGDCCRDFPVPLEPAEAERLEAQDWSAALGRPGPVSGPISLDGRSGLALLRRADGACVFLAADDRCLVHQTLGEAAKPLACRLFPFAFHAGPDGEPARAGASFACSSIALGEGQPLEQRRRELEALEQELGAVHPLARRAEPLSFTPGRAYSRRGVELLVQLLLDELQDAGRPFPQRILASVNLLKLVADSGFASLDDERSEKMVRAFASGVREQVERGLLRPPVGRPPLPQRLLFSQILALAARRTPGRLLTAGPVRRWTRQLGNLLAGLSFMAGGGAVQPVGRARRVALGAVRRQAPAADPASPAADAALTRYFVGHLSSGLLLDPAFQVDRVLPALGLLLRHYPAILLFARAACAARDGDEVAREDYAAALRTMDWNFGRVPWLVGPVGRVRARLLCELDPVLLHVEACAARPGVDGAAEAAAGSA